MEPGTLKTHLWNLSLGAATCFALAACGPLVMPEGETDTASATDTDPGPDTDAPGPGTVSPPDPTVGGQCLHDQDCPPGYVCAAGECIPSYGDTDYGCGTGGCCWDGCYYDTDTDTDWYECYVHEDCGPHEVCTERRTCEEPPTLQICLDAPVIAVQGLPTVAVEAFVSLAFVDANGDPAQDLVVGGSGSAELVLGPGDAAPIALPVAGRTVVDATAGDLDGDGDAELVLSTQEGLVLVLTGDGLGGYVEVASQPVEGSVHDLATLQWNGDQQLDVVGRVEGGPAVILWGDAMGGFFDVTNLVGEAPVTSLARGDLDGDAYGDVVLQDQGAVKRYQGSHSGTLTSDGWLVEGSGRTLATGAMDPGTQHEVIGTTLAADWTRVELWHEGGSPQFYALPGPRHAAELGDVDGDGTADLVLVGDYVVDYLRGTTEPSLSCVSTLEQPAAVLDAAVGDLDGDGRVDVVIGGAEGVTVLMTQ